ncbi:uncharacterized protein N7498_008517 [Penicillium cinerascens]|uniref:BZIP domain-containing protein n=1 Tax=Penicillium cinerascens TaxID=70096 RepID=A0A9W9JEU8_9EURO|nr:uncharacterized protein N7498_008517 [Penicillium cinerascens]KAJ5195079.1 hypothetical protein N7498_008517 [Penicillium cinerascens]
MDLGPGGTRQHATAQGKTKSEDLARLCNNQRRSRARRQEYVHHLERRVREYEESSAAREEQSQLALQKLRADNDAQKQRLDALSINRRHDRVESELTPNVFDTPDPQPLRNVRATRHDVAILLQSGDRVYIQRQRRRPIGPGSQSLVTDRQLPGSSTRPNKRCHATSRFWDSGYDGLERDPLLFGV